MRSVRLLFVLLLATSLVGCIASTTLIRVSPDGSGTVEQTVTMNPEAVAGLMQLAAGFGEKGREGQGKPPDLFSEKELQAAAPKLGEGVRFVSSERIKTKEAEGVKAIYAFTDITKLHINQKPDIAAPGAPAMSGSSREDVAFRFARRPGGSAVTVVFPDFKISPEEAGEKGKADPSQLAMMRELFKGLRISIAMEVAGRILKTNSPYVAGSTVTLLEIDFARLLEDPAAFDKLQGVSSLEEAKLQLRGIKGLKISTDKEVVVEFAGR